MKLFNVPDRPVISNCGWPTEKVSEKKNIPKDALLVTANVVGLWPSRIMAHENG